MRIKEMSFFVKSNGNFTAQKLADPVELKFHISPVCGTGFDSLLLVFTRAGLSVIDEIFDWSNIGKL